MPAPVWLTLPEPLITELKSVPCVIVFERLKPRRAPDATLMALDAESEPAVPPLPICSVPAVTLVVPV